MKKRQWLPLITLLIGGNCFADATADLVNSICPQAPRPENCATIIKNICQDEKKCSQLTQQVENCKGDTSCIRNAVQSFE